MMVKNNFPQKWIFIRGLTRGRFHWLGFEDVFKKYFDCESVFLPEISGNGELFDADSSVSIQQTVQQLKNQIDVPLENVGLLGISMGGMIAAQWATLFPKEISHLVLINTSSSLSPFYHRLQPAHYLALLKLFLIADPEKTEKFILSATCNDTLKWQSRFSEMTAFQKKHPVSLANFIRQLKMSGQANFKQKPLCQTLILTSEKDRLVNKKCSELIAQSWSIPIEHHPTAGHDLPFDDGPWILEQMRKHFGAKN